MRCRAWDVGQVVYMTRGMQERRDEEMEGYRKEGMQNWTDAGQEGCKKGEMLDRWNTGLEGCWKEGMQERRDAGNERHRKGAMQERKDSRGNECRKEGMQEIRNVKFSSVTSVHAWQELVCRQFVSSLFCMIVVYVVHHPNFFLFLTGLDG